MTFTLNNQPIPKLNSLKILLKAIVIHQDKLLTIQRRPDDTRPLSWDFPGGNLDPEDIRQLQATSGRGDHQDILINTLLREITEETNLTISAATVTPLLTASEVNQDKQLLIIGLGYQCHADNIQSFNLSHEHIAHQWVTPQQFLTLNFGDDNGFYQAIIQAYLKRQQSFGTS